jgi:tRNA dimethylallyltransferase
MPSQSQKPLVVTVVGPTASGKSDLAVELARRFNGEIISADSRQVYRGMDIGTGKITKREMCGITHHLLDVASPRSQFTVARYQTLARRAIRDILQRGKLPIICGGTGFYVDAALYEYALPSVKADPKLRKKLSAWPVEKLYKELKKRDPRRAANIDAKNPVRLIRALEVSIKSGRPSPAKDEALKKYSPFQIIKVGIKPPAEILRTRIHLRLLKRMKNGMIAEVKRLLCDGVSHTRLETFGLEYRYLSRYLRGVLTKEKMLEELEHQIYQYSKRQMTWFKRDKEIIWAPNPADTLKITSKIIRETTTEG